MATAMTSFWLNVGLRINYLVFNIFSILVNLAELTNVSPDRVNHNDQKHLSNTKKLIRIKA